MLSTQPITYEVGTVEYGTDEVASVYSWKIPQNWTSGGVVSTGSNVYTTQSSSITVTPDKCSSGEVIAWAKNVLCDETLTPSGQKAITVTRDWPFMYVSGPLVVCSSGNYSIVNLPSGTSVTWNSSSNVQLQSVQGSNQANFIKIGSAKGWIEGSISASDCSETLTLRKDIWLGIPQVYTFGNHLLDLNTGMILSDFCIGQSHEGEANHPAGEAGITDWDWRVTGGSVYSYGSAYENATIYPSSTSMMVELRATNTCGTTGWERMYTNTSNCSYLAISPNPTTTETTLSILPSVEEATTKENSATLVSSLEEDIEWDLEVYNQFQNLKLKQNKLKGKSTKINTTDWQEGIYIIRVKYKGELLTEKLIIKK